MAFRANRAGIRTLFGSGGPVGQHLKRVRRNTAQRARRKVGTRTLKLRQEIIEQPLKVTGREARTGVSARKDYALVHHQGSKPHVIRPRRKKALRFRVGTDVVFAKKVNHPGTKGNPFLVDALKEAVR